MVYIKKRVQFDEYYLEELFKGLPNFLLQMFKYVRTLTFNELPNYEYLITLP